MKTVSLKLPPQLSAELERAARQRGESKSAIMRSALEQFLNGRKPAPRSLSALELAGDLVGCIDGPGDLSTNGKYMEGFGK